MCITVEEKGKYSVVSLTETRLDAALAPRFREGMLQLVQGGRHFVVLDLSNVQFIDSSGLGAIVAVLKSLGSQGELSLCGAGENVARLFKLTRMDKVFRIYPDLGRALRAQA